MKFQRLEKTNYFSVWAWAVVKSLLLSLLICLALLVVCGYKFMIVTSGSMEPTLPVGSLVVIAPCEYKDLELGDILTMDRGGVYVTHRVHGKILNGVEVQPEDAEYNSVEARWFTKGDNSDSKDPAVDDDEVVGTVEWCFKSVGVVVRYVKANYKYLIILAVILFVFVEVLNYLKGRLETDDIECYENDEEE